MCPCQGSELLWLFWDCAEEGMGVLQCSKAPSVPAGVLPTPELQAVPGDHPNQSQSSRGCARCLG